MTLGERNANMSLQNKGSHKVFIPHDWGRLLIVG
jgi:hypothetical protein